MAETVDQQDINPENTPISAEEQKGPHTPVLKLWEPSWKRCVVCKEEYGAVNEAGLCRGCETNQDMAAKLEAEANRIQEAHDVALKEILGEKGFAEFHMHRFTPEAGTDQAYKAIRDFQPERDNLFLYGTAGAGKTHLAYALARQYMQPGSFQAEIRKVLPMVKWFRLRDPLEQEAELQKLAGSRVLVLDDLGVEKSTDFNLSILYELIDMRDMKDRNGMIVTSNLSPEEFAQHLGDDRIPSRLFGRCRAIKLEAKDHRLG